MKNKRYIQVIAVLVILNFITLLIIFTKPQWLMNNREAVATIGSEEISRQEWLNELEAKYGETVLKELIDQKVIEQTAKKYSIKVSEKEVDRQIKILKTTSFISDQKGNEERLKKQIKTNLLLEEILTKDVVVSEEHIEKYYEDNQNIFILPTSYLVSQIIVKTKKEAQQAIEELNDGSSFSVLAMERSIDAYSSIEGGNIGYVNERDDRLSASGLNAIKKLEKGKFTKPVEVEEGYAIYLLLEKIPKEKYPFSEVKNQIRRHIALEQMNMAPTADLFWEEADVDWFYGEKQD